MPVHWGDRLPNSLRNVPDEMQPLLAARWGRKQSYHVTPQRNGIPHRYVEDNDGCLYGSLAVGSFVFGAIDCALASCAMLSLHRVVTKWVDDHSEILYRYARALHHEAQLEWRPPLFHGPRFGVGMIPGDCHKQKAPPERSPVLHQDLFSL